MYCGRRCRPGSDRLTKIVDKIISAYKNRQWVSISMFHPSLPLAYGQNALAMISESRLSADDGIQVGAVTV